jgi:hypothetical protein
MISSLFVDSTPFAFADSTRNRIYAAVAGTSTCYEAGAGIDVNLQGANEGASADDDGGGDSEALEGS